MNLAVTHSFKFIFRLKSNKSFRALDDSVCLDILFEKIHLSQVQALKASYLWFCLSYMTYLVYYFNLINDIISI